MEEWINDTLRWIVKDLARERGREGSEGGREREAHSGDLLADAGCRGDR